MRNIEEDIKFIEEMIKEYKTFGDLHNPDYEDTDRIYKALENMLKRIKELENKYIIHLTDEQYRNLVDIIRKETKQEFKQRIKELEEHLKKYYDGELYTAKQLKQIEENQKKYFINKQKVKDLLTEIQEEYNKVQEQFDCIWNKKSKDDYERYKLQEFSAMQQQLGFILGKLEELLEESK